MWTPPKTNQIRIQRLGEDKINFSMEGVKGYGAPHPFPVMAHISTLTFLPESNSSDSHTTRETGNPKRKELIPDNSTEKVGVRLG